MSSPASARRKTETRLSAFGSGDDDAARSDGERAGRQVGPLLDRHADHADAVGDVADLADDVDPVAVGSVEVHEHQVDRFALQRLDRGGRIGDRAEDADALAGQTADAPVVRVQGPQPRRVHGCLRPSLFR